MKSYLFEGRYKIFVPIEVTAYSEQDALERILRLDPSVVAREHEFGEYQIVYIRCVSE